MVRRYLLAVAVVTAAALAACGSDDSDSLSAGRGNSSSPGGGGGSGTGGGGGSGGGGGGGGDVGSVPTNSPAGQAFFASDVFPFLSAGCAGCHDAAGPGPNWIIKADVAASYKLQFQMGFVTNTSLIVTKGAHGGITTNVLTAAQKDTFLTWVGKEIADGGQKALPNVLELLAKCIDQTKLQNIGLQNLTTTRRNGENANNCTGCNNAPCRTCHSGDEGSGFVMAINNNVLPADYTFQQTKLTNPPYLQKYFGVSPTGDPIASNAIKLKSDATVKDKPYTHPMFTLSANQLSGIDAFVNDAITKYKAGTCAP